MVTSKLEMIFKNQLDSKTRISIDNPRADITEAEVNTVMNDIVASGVFSSNGGDLVAVSGARVITTEVQELTL